LVQTKLAACVNLFPIQSTYWWQGKVEKSSEFGAFIKTKRHNFEKVKRIILKNHSYDVPCVVEIPIKCASKKYAQWLDKNVI
jgi:periplasmic divalent cation tolerance protein